jgi:hypothetical protein
MRATAKTPTSQWLPLAPSNPVDDARVAIWRLFQEGYVDEDMATAGLLAVDLGTRRAQRRDQALRQTHDSAPENIRRFI